MSVKLGRYKYIATQGPCPEGFHVPLSSEWTALCGVLTSTFGLASNATTMGTYLKMPAAGYRINTSTNVAGTGSFPYGMYWSSSSYNDNYSNHLSFDPSSMNMTHNNRSIGFSIRPFYNEGIAPNGGWQVLYQGTGSAGIYWHKDLGLITASGNGVTWYTIADKNLGATTVYNQGDTLTDDNVGGCFQWGNNYMFPGTESSETITTSATQVDATGYGPGNYYSSSTWITTNPWQSSTSNGNNLWGGVDGNIWKDVDSIKYEWKPGSSTVAYFPLTSDFVDVVTGNGPTASSGTIDFTTKDGVLCASCPSGSVERAYNNRNWSTGNNPLTWHMWCNKNSYSHEWQVVISTGYGATTRAKNMGFHNNQFWTGGWNNDTYHFDALIGQWALYTWTFDGSTTKAYLNGELKNSKAMTYSTDSNNYSSILSQVIQSANNPGNSADGYYRDIVIENKARTADEIVDYYNKTKGTYTGEGGGNDEVNGHSLDEHSMSPQGPAPDGYHVPLNTEWQGVKTIMDGLSLTGDGWRINLHMPFAGRRDSYSANIIKQGSQGYYWSSSPYESNGSHTAYCVYKSSSYINASFTLSRADACPIRCFKNSFKVPTSSWAIVQGTLGSAGIFWNQSEGLISITSNGTTGYTMQDKNLGATSVYNDGNSLTQANMGNMYQWGNNYGFQPTGSVTTSNTQVDTSGYGPGNYYSSSTFIARSSSPWDWSSVQNDDLWGGVSKAELKQYYSFNLLNEYIGEYHECDVNTLGPCPSGFHIPTRQEWHDLYDIGYALGLWDTTNYGRQLQLQFNIPVCGKLNNDGTYTSSPTDAVYWCADKQSSSYGRDVWLRTTTDAATIDDDTTMIRGGSIRPFRNMPLIPTTSDSNWNIPTGSNPANGGIYDNETEGVISISADGAHWMTLADKNCGATTKWYLNSTMSEANCGKFYQWGNNHGFPFTGATKISSTAVDASDYGPFSEYYDDDTFITTSPWDTSDNRNLWGGVSGPTRNCDISGGGDDWWYSDKNWEEYQNLVNSIGSVQFQDSGKRFKVNGGLVYIGNGIIKAFSGTTMYTIYTSDMSSTSKTISIDLGTGWGQWYFGENRILTKRGIIDFDGNVITSFSYDSITPGLPGVVWANSGYDIYKGVVDGDNITFTKIGTGGTDQSSGQVLYGRLGAYLLNGNDTSGSGYSSYINPETNTITNFTGGSSSRATEGASGPDGKIYRFATRTNGWGRMQKIGTGDEGFVGTSLSTNWLNYGVRFGKFLGNFVSGGMNTSNGTGNGYGSNNYFIDTSGNLSLVQSNAFAYDAGIIGMMGCIDENGYIYCKTWGGGSGVVLKTDKTFTDLNWKNPYLWR